MSTPDDPPPAGGEWEAWRQDDNGVRLRVEAFATREAAAARIAGFESHHHKQTYWIEHRAPGRG
ncbi:MAG TPA: hypothetical protein VF771_18080 [Longimicrobiaceae bacterium]